MRIKYILLLLSDLKQEICVRNVIKKRVKDGVLYEAMYFLKMT